MNDWLKAALAGLAGSLLLWLILFAAYSLDRPDAASVALVTVLLVTPPLLSYLAVMQVTRGDPSLIRRVLVVYAAALAWLAVQRFAAHPLFGFGLTLGESMANFILLPALGVAGWLGARSFLYLRRLDRATALQRDTELKLLEAQLAPHMLFNMLNTVYAALLTDRDKAVDLFMAMSETLRHAMSGSTRRWTPMHEEIAFIEHYSALERARNPASHITVQTEGDMDAPFPPMLLATLFENAVKHGRLADGGLDITVRASVGDERMLLTVSNRKGPAPAAGGSGLGLANIRGRLALLYPHHSALDIDTAGEHYAATIRIDL